MGGGGGGVLRVLFRRLVRFVRLGRFGRDAGIVVGRGGLRSRFCGLFCRYWRLDVGIVFKVAVSKPLLIDGVEAGDVVGLDEADEAGGVFGVRGVPGGFQTVGPAGVVHHVKVEEGAVAWTGFQKKRMIVERLLHGGVLAEALLQFVVVNEDGVAGPFLVALDAEVVVSVRGEVAHSAGAFKNPLRDGDAGGDFVLVHLVDGWLLITLDISVNVGFSILRGGSQATDSRDKTHKGGFHSSHNARL